MTDFCEQRDFLAQFLKHPGRVGAVRPSSAGLGRMMADSIDWAAGGVVVEYGPGTGAFTGEILARLRPGARFFAVELNPVFCEALRVRFPELHVHQASVQQVAELCRRENVEQIDAILSGLPWAAFSDSDQAACLGAMMSVLKPGGQFATFAYLQGLLLPAGRRFRRRLGECFSTVESSRVVWRNFPPAIVYRCRR